LEGAAMTRRFGCELEFSSSKFEVARLLSKALKSKLRRIGINVTNYKKWQIKDDRSTVGEVISPIFTLKDLPKILDVCRLLKENNIEVTKDDGFHVHVQIRKTEIPNVIGLWLKCEEDLEFIFPKHRRNNYYCKRLLRSKKLPPVMSLQEGLEEAEDHHAVLSTFRDDIGTIEFRIAEGTFDPDFVNAWITFCVKFVEYASKQDSISLLFSKPHKLSIGKLLSMIGLSEKNKQIIMKRKRINRSQRR